MSNSKTEIKPLVFIDTDDVPPPPPYLRQLTFLKEFCRPLWQEEAIEIESSQSSDSGVYSADDEMEVDIKRVTEIPKVIYNIERISCTPNGVCSECELSRKIEETYQSEKAKCSQQ